MTWTYNLSLLATSKLAQVRFLMGDTVATSPQMQDEEINFAITQRGSIYGAAADVCRALSAKLSREADTVDKDLRTMMSSRAKAYAARANALEIQGKVRGGALPYSGGISILDKVAQELDTDRVPPFFNRGMDTNYLPVAPVGNEDTPLPSADDDSDDV
jgi:hypothetical protein